MRQPPPIYKRKLISKKDLTTSIIDRKNILNNNLAIPEIYKAIGLFPRVVNPRFQF